jgi:agmatinase
MTDFGGAIKKSEVYDFAIFGIPFDDKSCFKKGAAMGPDAIREASTSQAINAWTELGVNLEEDTIMVDLGDISVGEDYFALFPQIQKMISAIVQKGAVPLILGGDHSISYPAVKAIAAEIGPVDILHFDAHPDLYDHLYDDRYSHACPFTRILEEGLVERLVQVGIRAATAEHKQRATEFKALMFEMKDLKEMPPLSFSHPLYISFDMDALDPAFAPGVSHHEPGGLSTRQVLEIIHSLEANIIGMDIVELNAPLDPSGRTAAAAVKILLEVAGKVVHSQKIKMR